MYKYILLHVTKKHLYELVIRLMNDSYFALKRHGCQISYIHWLVVWNIFIFPILRIIIPTD